MARQTQQYYYLSKNRRFLTLWCHKDVTWSICKQWYLEISRLNTFHFNKNYIVLRKKIEWITQWLRQTFMEIGIISSNKRHSHSIFVKGIYKCFFTLKSQLTLVHSDKFQGCGSIWIELVLFSGVLRWLFEPDRCQFKSRFDFKIIALQIWPRNWHKYYLA